MHGHISVVLGFEGCIEFCPIIMNL